MFFVYQQLQYWAGEHSFWLVTLLTNNIVILVIIIIIIIIINSNNNNNSVRLYCLIALFLA